MTKKTTIPPGTLAVRRHRERAAKQGAHIIYASVDADAVAALDAITMRRVCTKREAVEYALKRVARDMVRAR